MFEVFLDACLFFVSEVTKCDRSSRVISRGDFHKSIVFLVVKWVIINLTEIHFGIKSFA